jgi:hypothetical protein
MGGKKVAEIDDLMAVFAAAGPRALVCRGPEHPAQPEPALAERLRLWLATHPFLHRDEGYVAFLRRYCGAVVGDRAGRFWATVHGFHPEVGYLDEYDFCRCDPTVPGLDGRGLYPFAIMRYDRPGPGRPSDRRVLFSFSFDGTGTRHWGVYRTAGVRREPETEPQLLCGSFCAWLRMVFAGEVHSGPPDATPGQRGMPGSPRS